MPVTDIIPLLTAQAVGPVLPKGSTPRDRAEVVSQHNGGMPGVEVMLQKLLEIRGEMGGPDKMIAERNAPVREFHSPPVTYDGFANTPRRPPSSSIFLVA